MSVSIPFRVSAKTISTTSSTETPATVTTSSNMFGSCTSTTSIFGAGIFADTTTASSVKSEKKPSTTSAYKTSNNIFANSKSNGIFGAANTFTPPAISSIETTSASVATTASITKAAFTFGAPAGIVTTAGAPIFGGIANISNGSFVFSKATLPTSTIANELGMPSSSIDAGAKFPRRFQHLPFADFNRPFSRVTQHFGQALVVNDALEEPAETRLIGQLGVAMSSYIWKISNFAEVCKSSEKDILCVSPVFKIGVGEGEKICKMYLYPCGSSGLCKEYASIFMECQNNFNPEALISFSILDANLQITNETFSSVLITTPDNVTKIGCSRFVKRNVLLDSNSGLLSDDTLTIVCHISLRSMDVRPGFPSELKINNDFGHLLESEKFSDLILEVEDKEFRVHKSILAARSSMFHKMFDVRAGALNVEQNKIKLTDVKYEVMKQILRFIYTEKVDKLTELAYELLVAAHRFKLEDLKALCEESLFKNLDIANVIDAHVLAEEYDSKWLKDKTTDFIIDNAHRVINTLGYKNLVDSHPRLLDELFCEMVRRRISPPIETPVSSL